MADERAGAFTPAPAPAPDESPVAASAAPAPVSGEPSSASAAVPAAISLVYESRDGRLCLFEDANGHLTAVDSSCLA